MLLNSRRASLFGKAPPVSSIRQGYECDPVSEALDFPSLFRGIIRNDLLEGKTEPLLQFPSVEVEGEEQAMRLARAGQEQASPLDLPSENSLAV